MCIHWETVKKNKIEKNFKMAFVHDVQKELSQMKLQKIKALSLDQIHVLNENLFSKSSGLIVF